MAETALDGTRHKDGCWYPKDMLEEAAYQERWPNHCGRCDGWGGFPFHDSDTGYSGADPCPECLERNRCPRCGGGIIAEAYWDASQYAVCDNCGYIESKTRGGAYVEDVCSCIYEAELREAADALDDIPF